VLRGAAMVSAVRIDDWDTPSKNNDVHRYIISAAKPSVLWIPPGYANGFKSLVPSTLVVVFSTATLEESKNDDYRWPPDSFGDTWTVQNR
jgi:dTDP-4-dehydrorhamnose 3,5-epimerase